MSQPPLIFVIGPTASGKSSLAESLAQHFPLELISMDSAQIYRGMDIGTAKPGAEVRARIPHHLIDILDPAQRYSAAQFARDARQLIHEIHGRGRIPVLVGGTFLYMRALLEGLHDMPPADARLRKEIEESAGRRGWPALHEELTALDAEAAAQIHPNDAQRIQRALEVVRLSGAGRGVVWQGQRRQPWTGPVLKLAILPARRQALRELIAQRFEQMMALGFLDEVRALYARPDLDPQLPSIRSVGYRQLWEYLDRRCELDDAVERGIIATRQYAKRQMTWLRRENDLEVLPQAPEQRLEIALARVEGFLKCRRA